MAEPTQQELIEEYERQALTQELLDAQAAADADDPEAILAPKPKAPGAPEEESLLHKLVKYAGVPARLASGGLADLAHRGLGKGQLWTGKDLDETLAGGGPSLSDLAGRAGVPEMGKPYRAMLETITPGVHVPEALDFTTRDALGAAGEMALDPTVPVLGSAVKAGAKGMGGVMQKVLKTVAESPTQSRLGELDEMLKGTSRLEFPEMHANLTAERAALDQAEQDRKLLKIGDPFNFKKAEDWQDAALNLRRRIQKATDGIQIRPTPASQAPISSAAGGVGRAAYRKGVAPLVDASEKNLPELTQKLGPVDPFLLEHGVSGPPKKLVQGIEKNLDQYDELATELESSISNRGVTGNFDDALKPAMTELAELEKKGTPGSVAQARQILGTVASLGDQPINVMIATKSQWQKWARAAYGDGGLEAGLLAQIYAEGARGMRETIEKAAASVDPSLGVKLQKLNQAQSRFLSTLPAAHKMAKAPQPGFTGDIATAAVAALAAQGSPEKALKYGVAAVAGKHALQGASSPATLTRSGRLLTRIEKMGHLPLPVPKFAGKMGMTDMKVPTIDPALRYLLYQQGRPEQAPAPQPTPSPWTLVPKTERK